MKMSRKEQFTYSSSLTQTARTATANGSSVDLQGYGSATMVVQQVSWTDGTHTIAMQESDDNSTFTDVAAGDMDGSPPAITASGTTITKVGYLGKKRYLRGRTVVTGSPSTGAIYGINFILDQSRKEPR